ncbi:MAG: rRNA (cytidine1402-2-O)-methyltransferase [Acidimicrobiaceae bacterium]|nr:rRNA (cytidine1402-2-O)-methyltransferase [Acidimicrobiaceae bacterium]
MTKAETAPDVAHDGRGRLVLVGTPIGNLGDLAPRAIEALTDAKTIACEDTRNLRKLLSAAGVSTAGKRLLVMADHNEAAAIRQVLALLDKGERVAVVTDAGMPGVSDPGERIVAAAANANHLIEVVPGPSAALAGLVVSGLPSHRFVFEGFLPRKGSGRSERLQAVADEPRTTVLYEAPHRVAQTVRDLADACGPLRRVALARELTKLHEEVFRGSLAGAVEHVDAHEPRGEYVIVLDGAPPPGPATEQDIADALARHQGAGESKKDAIAAVAAELRVPKRVVYNVALTSGN